MDSFFGGQEGAHYPSHSPYGDMGLNSREYAVVALENNNTGGQSISIMRLLSKEEASDIVHSRYNQPPSKEQERISAAMHFIKHCNNEMTPKSLLVESSPSGTPMGLGSQNDCTYEIFTPELPVEQTRALNMACVTLAQFWAQGIDPKTVQLAKQFTDDGG